MQIFEKTTELESLYLLKELPVHKEYSHGFPAKLLMDDGTVNPGSCISCKNPQCMFLGDDEIECVEVPSFPKDNSVNACPVDAIKWNKATGTPMIDRIKCIRCGICMRRCPVGAIYFDGEVKVNSPMDGDSTIFRVSVDYQDVQQEQINRLLEISCSGNLLTPSNQLFENIYNKLFSIEHYYQNIIGRNLLIALGCNSAMSRIGDVYTRMDAVYSSVNKDFGAVEIEFGRDTLDASRGILDDIAVLNTRYGIKKDQNYPLVICLQLPNARQGYWQVVKDIRVVEGIRINTISLGGLMILNWNLRTFTPGRESYHLDYDDMSLRNILVQQLGSHMEINVDDKFLGIFEPEK